MYRTNSPPIEPADPFHPLPFHLAHPKLSWALHTVCYVGIGFVAIVAALFAIIYIPFKVGEIVCSLLELPNATEHSMRDGVWLTGGAAIGLTGVLLMGSYAVGSKIIQRLSQ